jgi:Transposase DNA-binding/Transposase DDE domain
MLVYLLVIRKKRDEHDVWAREEFAHAELGDQRRTQRLVEMAASVARRPAGTVTAVFKGSAEREGAFRLLENDNVSADAIAAASHAATIERCTGFNYVFVAVDSTSLLLTDETNRKGFGRVGTSTKPSQGLYAMNALAVAADGTPLGLVEQQWWVRDQPSARRFPGEKPRHPARFREKETRHWIDVLTQIDDQFKQHPSGARPWFQLDRGGDCWPVLSLAIERDLLLTVRSTHNRRLRDEKDKTAAYLWSKVQGQRALGCYTIEVSARPGRPARSALIEVRACEVTIELRVSSKKREYVTLYAVLASEKSDASDRLEWKLLTTHPVTSFEQARAVIDGYASRWRIEEFHRAWKSGVCNVEASQLRARDHFIRWATLLAAVAARAIRLSYLARSQPDQPAREDFSQDEIDAVLILKKRTDYRRGSNPPLGKLVLWIAELGGYTGKSSGGPPGPKVIGRGLQCIEGLAVGLKNMREMR